MRHHKRLLLFFGFLGAAILVASPAFAELTSTPQTSWGVQTKGASNTIAQWDALTWAVDQVDSTIFIGGNYLEVTNGDQVHSQAYLAAFDADTGRWQSWFRPQVGDAVFALQPTPDGGLLVGGEMGQWNGVTRGALVKIDPKTGDLWPGWNTRAFGGPSVIRDLSLEADGYVYAVGNFTTVTSGNGPMAAGGAFRFDPITGAIDTNWLPSLENGTGWGVSRSKTQAVTYIAGFFQSVDGDTTAQGFVGIDDAGSITANRDAIPFNGCSNWSYCSQLYDVEATEFGDLWVGGVEHALYVVDEGDGSLIKMHYSGCDPSKNVDCQPNNWYGGEFQELERVGNRIYATCHCWYDLFSADEVMAHARPEDTPNTVHSTVDALMAFDVVSAERINSFRPYLTGTSGGFGMHVNPDDGCLWATGGFQSYGQPGGAQPPARDVVRICDSAGPTPHTTPVAAPPAPELCSVALVDPADPSLGASVTWTNAPTSVGTIIYRSVDGGGSYWRGRVNPPLPSEFVEVPAVNTVSSYSVLHVYPAGQRSAPAPCGSVDLMPQLVPPSSCLALVDAGGVPSLSWDAGNDAAAFIIRRSVDGGPSYWRGRTSETTFTGATLTPGRSYDYTVTSQAADGSTAGPVPCNPTLTVQGPELIPPSACTATIDQNGRAALSWDAGSNATNFVIRRSVNGGTAYWRGSTPTTNFVGATLEAGRTFDYTVTAKAADGSTAPPVPCNPTLTVEVPQLGVLTSCDATLMENNEVVVGWLQVENAQRYVVRRSANNGTFYWRGSVNADQASNAAFFDTPISDTRTYVYSVTAIGLDGTTATPVECAPSVTVVPPPIAVITTCTVSPDFTISWTDPVVFDVVVYRSVNGGPDYWRGRVSPPASSFSDTGSPTVNYSYSVVVVAPDGRRGDPGTCA